MDAPFEEQLQLGFHRVGAGFHYNEATLWHRLQFVRRHKRTLHHLQRLGVIVLALGYRTGQNGSAAQVPRERICCLTVWRETAKNGVLAVITHDLAALLAIVLFQLGKALDNGYQCQPAGPTSREQGQDVKGRHSTQLIAEKYCPVGQLTTVFICYGKQLTGKVLNHQTGYEILGCIFFR